MRSTTLTLATAPIALASLAFVAAHTGDTAATRPGLATAAELPALVSPTELVSAQRGTLPIVLCAPHGGGASIPGAERRKGPQGQKLSDTFAVEQDVRTAELVWIVAQRLTVELGAKPYVVVAQFHRRYADANRSADEGTECDAAQREHAAYHRALRTCVDEVRARFGNALLVDLHGQAKEPDAIVRGTRNGRSVKLLLARAGAPAITNKDGLFGWFETRGVRVLPANLATPDTLAGETLFTGGHTVALYGSDKDNGIDAVQFEVGSTLREPEELWKTGDSIARALALFATKHLGVAEPR
jgi:hypothetical protein